MGFNADLDLKDAGSSLSVDGGKTTLIGGVITKTDSALQTGFNNYVSKGGIEMQDIDTNIKLYNQTIYKKLNASV